MKPFNPDHKPTKQELKTQVKNYELYLKNTKVDPEEIKRRLNSFREELGLDEDIEKVTEIFPAMIGAKIGKSCIRIARDTMDLENVEMFLKSIVSILNEELYQIENCRFMKKINGRRKNGYEENKWEKKKWI